MAMEWFQIGETGFSMEIPERQLPAGRFLQKFHVSEEAFDKLEDRITVSVAERAELFRKMTKRVPVFREQREGKAVWQQNGKLFTAASYGRCRYAVIFSPEDWRGHEFSIQLDPEVYQEPAFNLNQLLALTGLHTPLLYRRALTLHASCVEADFGGNSGALLFTGPSGIGKSTQAELWREYAGAGILNGDRAVVRQETVYGIPVCGSSRICVNFSRKLRAVAVLCQGRENRVEVMSPGEKYRALLLASAFYPWDPQESELAHQLVLQLMEKTEILRLVCRPDREAVQILRDYLEKTGGKEK